MLLKCKKKKKYLGANPAKYAQNPCAENCKAFLTEIKAEASKCRDGLGRLHMAETQSPQSDKSCQCDPDQVLTDFLELPI
jgi:hypothetical protein